MSHILGLSNELLILIGESLDRGELSALAQANRHFHALFTPILNRHALHPSHRTTAFYWACATGNSQLVSLLVSEGANFHVRRGNRRRELFRLPHHTPGQNSVICGIALDAGATIVVQDNYEKCTPLHLAARNGQHFTLQSLLEIGGATMIECKDIRGWTVLSQAVYEGNEMATRLLLSNGALPNTKCKTGCTPLHYAASSGNRIITELLLDSGADLTIWNNSKKTPVEVVSMGNISVRNLLLRRTGRNFRADTGETALHFAVEHENAETAEIVELLLRRGVPINAQESSGWTALFVAIEGLNYSLCELLLENGADPNIQDVDGWTPLQFSTSLNDQQTIKMLLEYGADANIRNHEGETAIDLADINGMCLPFVHMLERTGPNFRTLRSGRTTLHLAARISDIDTVRRLLDEGANINETDNKGQNALHNVIDNTYPEFAELHEVIRLLVERGIDTSARDLNGNTPFDIADECHMESRMLALNPTLEEFDVNFQARASRRTLLHFAALLGNLAVAEDLLELGAEVNALDATGLTPLHLAVGNHRRRMISLLLDYGADTTIRDINGETPIFRALKAESMYESRRRTSAAMIRQLIVGINVNVPNYWGSTLLQIATEKVHRIAIGILREHGASGIVGGYSGRIIS